MFSQGTTAIIITLLLLNLAGVQVCVSSPALRTCARIPFIDSCSFGNQSEECPSDCSYFFDAMEAALVNDSSALYSLQRAFFPNDEQKPRVVDIYMTLILEQAIDLSCDSERNIFRNETVASLNRQSVINVCNSNSEVNCTRKEYRWHHVWTSSVLTRTIERESLGLLSSINSIAYITLQYSLSQTSVIVATERTEFQPRETAFLELIIPSLHCLPKEPEMTLKNAWEEILPWIHAYTLHRGRIEFSDGERAFTFEDNNQDPNSKPVFTRFQRREIGDSNNSFITYLISMHILLQVAIGLTIMKLIPSYYTSISKGKEGKQPKLEGDIEGNTTGREDNEQSNPAGKQSSRDGEKANQRKSTGKQSMRKHNSSSVSIFWASVFFVFILDVIFVGLDLYLIVSVYVGVSAAIDVNSQTDPFLDHTFVFGMLGTVVTFILIIVQFIIAVTTPKNTKLYIPGLLELFCCFFHCRCKKIDGEFWNKVLQTFAVWSLMVFLQLVAGSVIPYLVLAIVDPIPSVTFLALGVSTLFCLIVFLASLIQIGSTLKESPTSVKLIAVVQGLVFLVFLGFVGITVIIYQGVIQSGTNTGVVSGIILSLIPAAIIGFLGVAVKYKILGDGQPKEPMESVFSRTTSLFARVPTTIAKRKVPVTSNGSHYAPNKNEEGVETTSNGTGLASSMKGLESSLDEAITTVHTSSEKELITIAIDGMEPPHPGDSDRD